MTTDNTDYRSRTTSPFLREEKRTTVRETLWTYSGMRSLSASYSDGLHRVAFITHDRNDNRQTTINVHRIEEIEVNPDDELALTISIRSDDGTPLTLTLHDLTLARLMEALDTALLSKASIATEAL